MKRLLLIITLFTRLLMADTGFNCFTVIAGKECTVDGSVLFGHNEDDSGDQIVNMYKVPTKEHDSGKFITLKNGGKLEQVHQTNAYVWLEMPGMEFSDGYVNEHGVVIASDNCPSREDSADFTDGGIGYWLRRAMAERATSAREAVKIGGALVEKYGYTQAGRSYCIADPDEAWVMAVVKGKHWVAQRVPDDKVMIIPNYYMIQEVDLSDRENFMGSADIISYAVNRGWYDPKTDGDFNFRETYGINWSINHQHNINRQWGALRLISEKPYEIDDNFPFAVTPEKKIGLPEMFNLLRDHYEGTDLENTDHSQTPHKDDNRPICTYSTQYALVAQLNREMPFKLPGVLWYAPVQPCLHPFVPFYINAQDLPGNYAYKNHKTGLKLHFSKNYDQLKTDFRNHAFIDFTEFSTWVNEDYYARSRKIIKSNQKLEDKIMQQHSEFHQALLKNKSISRQTLLKKITQYSHEKLQLLLENLDFQK